ncbi:MAG: hypothetical protein LUQ53_02130, partial [Methanothrix sp.]|nr:hypothetical protein [Methanothrix sp.]
MSEKTGANVIRTIFELLVLLAAAGVIFGGLAIIVLFSPWSKEILERLLAFDIRFAVELMAFLTIAAIILLLSVLV